MYTVIVFFQDVQFLLTFSAQYTLTHNYITYITSIMIHIKIVDKVVVSIPRLQNTVYNKISFNTPKLSTETREEQYQRIICLGPHEVSAIL